MASDKVAIVTGSNKGIGFAIVKGLCKRFDGAVYLTSRDRSRGLKAAEKIKDNARSPIYHQLDIGDSDSVRNFAEHIKEKHGGIDILINNAGVSGGLDTSYKSNKNVIDINYNGLLTVEKYLFPLLRKNARVVNVSSDCGHLSNVRNKQWIERLSKNDFTRNDIEEFVNWYLEGQKTGTFNNKDLADNGTVSAYRVSKVAMCALTMIQQKDLGPRGISVNSMHPGLTSTDMVMRIGFLTADEAAETPLYLVLDAPQSLKGKYIWYDKSEVDWFDINSNCYFKISSIAATLVRNVFKYPFHLLSSSRASVGLLSVGLIVFITKYNDYFIEALGF